MKGGTDATFCNFTVNLTYQKEGAFVRYDVKNGSSFTLENWNDFSRAYRTYQHSLLSNVNGRETNQQRANSTDCSGGQGS